MKEVKVYVGSLWHQDCDPFVRVFGLNKRDVERKLAGLADDEYSDMVDDTPENEEDPEDDICDSGVWDESWGFAVSELSQEQIEDLLIDGVLVTD